MSRPRYFTCGAFVCSDDGDMHERVTCVFDSRKTSRRLARMQVKGMHYERHWEAASIYLFNGIPLMAIVAAEAFPDALLGIGSAGAELVTGPTP